MGGFGTAFAGALEGVGDALHREHQEQFATEVENRKSLMKMYGEMAMNPNVPPHVQREALRRWGTITQVPYNKKLPSDLTKPIDPAALLAQQPQQQGAPQGPSQPQGQPQAAAAPAAPSASIVLPGAAASPGPASPVSSGGGASPGVLQGQANQLPPAQVQAAAPPPAPPSGASGASGAGITYTPQEIASQDASRASQITSAQTEAQLISKYQAYVKMGMDPQRAAFLASGMAAMTKPTGSNVILDDGTHKTATKMFDPTDMRFHYWAGDEDLTDRVVSTATSNAQVQAWPKITERGVGGAPAAIQMAPNGPVFRRDDPSNPLEVQQQFATLGAPMTTTRSGGTTTDEFGNTHTSSTSTRSVGGATPPPAPSKSTGGGSTRAASPQASSVSPAAPHTKFQVERADRSYQQISGQLDKAVKPVEDLYQRFGRLQDTVNQNTPQADALVAPELLTVMAGGQGSGLRMNEAEISRIVGGRSKWQDLQAAVNKWKLDPKAALSITTEQRSEIRSLMDTVSQRLRLKQNIINDVRDKLLSATTPEEHRALYTGARRVLAQVDQGQVMLKAPTGQIKMVPLDQVDALLDKGATVAIQ